MKINIDKIAVNGLGPITSFQWELKDINLIYGKNEQGKTYVVEYLLNALFHKFQKTRKLDGTGQVHISGLAKNVIRFDSKSRNKLEDYLFTDDSSVDLSRLLVVKAGQSRLAPGIDEGINKSVLKDYLSDQQTLDSIMDRIPSNIKKSIWQDNKLIPGAQTGECRTWKQYSSELKKTDRLLAEVDDKYNLGEIARHKSKLAEVDDLIQEQEKARRFLAYQKSKKIDALNQALEKFPQSKLDELKSLNNEYRSLEKQIIRDQEELNQLEPQCKHYDWLKIAIIECEKRPGALKMVSDMVFIIPMVLLIFAAILFAFLSIALGSLITGLLALGVFVLALLHYRSKLKMNGDITEVNKIFQSFEEKFGSKAKSVTDLKAIFDHLSPKFYSRETIKKQIKDRGEDLDLTKTELVSRIAALHKGEPEIDTAHGIIAELQDRRDTLEGQRENEMLELASLTCDPDEYAIEPASIEFNNILLKKYQNQKAELEQTIQGKVDALNNLKQRLCDLTNQQITSSWEVLIDALRDHRDKYCQWMNESKAKIGAGVVITEVINNIRDQEDENISKALTSQDIRKPIKALTHTYQGVEMEGDEIFVFNDFTRYPIHQLSTGAQEQILLALRIGIASHFLKDHQMFLILDDAFQHSDWDRRVWMVDQMADLASMGWQIIYFAMDDHIKDLFEERIKPKMKDHFASFELKN